MTRWVYFSSQSGNTAKLMQRTGLAVQRIPARSDAPMPCIDQPFILVTPSFGDAQGKGAVPKPVIRFLNAPQRRQWLRGVVGCGDRNFGAAFTQAADVIAQKCHVAVLARIEMSGTAADIAHLQALDAQASRFELEHAFFTES